MYRKTTCMGLNGRIKLDCILGENSFEIHTGENDYSKHTKPKVITHRCFLHEGM